MGRRNKNKANINMFTLVLGQKKHRYSLYRYINFSVSLKCFQKNPKTFGQRGIEMMKLKFAAL